MSVICMVKLWKRYAEKLRSIILLHFGLVTFRFAYGLWENPKNLICMISGFSDVSPSPNTNTIYLLRPQDTSTNPGKIQCTFKKYSFYKYQNFKTQQMKRLIWKRQAPTNHEDPSYTFLKILDMGSISSWKHEMESW